MKKAQIQQVFVFAIALVIFASVVFFGYKAINEFIDRGEQVSFVSFKNNLVLAVSGIANQYGSVTVFDSSNLMIVPEKYKMLCFVDLDMEPSQSIICDEQSEFFDGIACDVWQTDWDTARGWQQADQNMFLTPKGISPISLGRIKMKGGDSALCVRTVTGRVDFRIEGKGDCTLIST